MGASVGDSVVITIANWDKFNPKRDQKTYTWLRLSNDISTDPKLFGLNCEQKYVWIEILCQASKKNYGEVEIKLSQLSHVCMVSTETVKSAISFLSDQKIISVARGRRRSSTTPARQNTTPTYERTNDTNVRTNNTSASQVFDFDSIYQKFPRKEGKQKGISRLKAQIRTQKDYEDVSLALDHYIERLRVKGTEAKFIKHFSTWVSEWREWLDPSTGSGQDFSNGSSGLSLSERLARKQAEGVA